MDFTPYSTVKPLISNYPSWISSEEDQERIASYDKYEQIYWQAPEAFKLQQRGDETPIYIPNARTIVDSTAHYLLKGLKLNLKGIKGDSDLKTQFDAFLKREKFYSRFHVAKHSGVARGDFIYHLTADPTLPEGSRLSLVSVDPGRYFPEYDPDDFEKIIAISLVDEFFDKVAGKTRIKRLTYSYEYGVNGRKVFREEAIWELENWDVLAKRTKVKQTLPLVQLPEEITAIPVYHFKNIDWQGQDFGSSELRGFERIQGSINQTLTDEEVALALEGLGVYATDAGRPVDDTGKEVDWEVAPARVMEVGSGSFFKRVEGITSVTPMLDHARYLEEKLMEASATFRAGSIDVQVAASGIALAIRFLPTLAKIDQRDNSGLDLLSNMFYDWKAWMDFYESVDFGDIEIEPEIGDKLPENRVEKLNELNNMLDREVISKQFYRDEMRKLGYDFPDDIEEQIMEEVQAAQDAATPDQLVDENGNNIGRGNGSFGSQGGRPSNGNTKGSTLPKKPNQSNNAGKTNESKGTEVGNGAK